MNDGAVGTDHGDSFDLEFVPGTPDRDVGIVGLGEDAVEVVDVCREHVTLTDEPGRVALNDAGADRCPNSENDAHGSNYGPPDGWLVEVGIPDDGHVPPSAKSALFLRSYRARFGKETVMIAATASFTRSTAAMPAGWFGQP